MKVFLIVPRCSNPKQTYREYPLGVGLIATALKQRGCEVTSLRPKCRRPRRRAALRPAARDFEPDIVGFSVITPSYPIAKAQIRAAQTGIVRRYSLLPAAFMPACFPKIFWPTEPMRSWSAKVARDDGDRRENESRAALGKVLPGVVFRDESGRMVRPVPPAKCLAADDLADRRSRRFQSSFIHASLDDGFAGLPASLHVLLQLRGHDACRTA